MILRQADLAEKYIRGILEEARRGFGIALADQMGESRVTSTER